MKKVMLFTLLLAGFAVHSQTLIQPVSSGDYWRIDDYQRRLPELANPNTFPRTISFSNGYLGVSNVWANRIIGANEIHWVLSGVQNVSDFYVEYSRDMHNFERAGLVHLLQAGNNEYVFRHSFIDDRQVYYRLALVQDGRVLAYTPAIQLANEVNTTKVFPTVVQGSTMYVQTANAYDKLQVINGASQSVYEKPLDKQTGTITVGLPSLPRGVYFVRLLSRNAPQHVQRILVD
jgi:hypothetical protein